MISTNQKRYLRSRNESCTTIENTPKNIGKVFIFFIPIFIYAWFYIQSVKIDYRINNELKKELNNLRAQNQKLEAELKMMISPEKLEKIACAKYGFKVANHNQIIIINKKTVSQNENE